MKSFIILFLFSLISHAQDGISGSENDTIPLTSLPIEFQNVVNKKILKLIERDTVSGRFTEKNGALNLTYNYKIYVKDSLVLGTYLRHVQCDSCDIEPYVSLTFQTVRLYCCKDSNHDVKETAKTLQDMREIQRTKGCRKIGFCNF